MEEEVGKKVTRLRRRLSVEAEESPSAPSTPTKKRAGRLAAKPQLELIDENSTDITPKKTKKSAVKTTAEPEEEKPVTPARRSTRIRSNTSLLSDTPTLDVPEDKGTPSRRSTRIKSNTSIVSETTQSYESPRAKRAARRISQVGSDNDTPTRTVRRTRKNSTSSIDKTAELNTSKTGLHVNEAIKEKVEKKVSTNTISPKAESPLRKSPRLNRSSGSVENKENHPTSENTIIQSQEEAQAELITKDDTKINESSGKTSQNDLSVSSSNLIKQLESEPPKKSSIANKSTSNLEDNLNKGKRHRTKSWTTISASPSNDASFCSDSEFVGKKGKKKITSIIHHMSGSGDGLLNLSSKSVTDKSQSKKLKTELVQDTSTVGKSSQANNITMGDSTNSQTVCSTEDYFEKAPSSIIKPLVYIEDSDSNSATAEKVKEKDSEDQCVPVVQHNLDDEKSKQASNLSYEPMDIDETLPTFIDNNDSVRLESKELNRSPNKSSRKSIAEFVYNENTNEETQLMSKRKSSLINNETPTESFSLSFSNDKTDESNKSLRKSVPLTLDEIDASVQSKRKSSISDYMNNEEYKKTLKSQINEEVQDANSSTVSQHFIKKSNKIKTSLNKSQEYVDTPNITMQFNKDNLKDSKRKSSISEQNKEDSIKMNNSLNKSTRKSSMMQESELNITNNENKSTLVLSQLKDDSAVETNVESVMCEASKDINECDKYQTKSINISNNNNKIIDKKNVSLTYSTSTPLQQKSLKKLGAINTSIITPNSVSKVGKKDKLASKHESSDSDSASDDSDEELSKDKSKIVDDEAEEASDDYESGDSRDSDEKEYEEQNEILETGETLDSEEDEDLTDDSDYEKGSFIVSSDDDDKELLSGSGDDLSMSADELTMSAKSKKKYNERKLKEQKKASQEMFEARHQSQNFGETKNRKKSSRQLLDSSDSDLDEDVALPKKNRRQRIDSSQDTSAVKPDAELSITKKKKKTKRSDSLCENSIINEKEITVNKDTSIENADPLEMKNLVKQEPKTPQKDFNISTIAITNIEEVEQVNIDENKSMINADQTKDPLQNTVIQKDNDEQEDDDSISENEEITQNYESVLSNLNSVKVKSQDISLNLNKKVKDKPKEPIVDQLNLTQVKKSKKKRVNSASLSEQKKFNKSGNDKTADNNKSVRIHDEDSSDSIDMKLLFPEDSNDSVTCSAKNNENQDDTFIPLKQTEAKTNILENTDNAAKTEATDESVLNVSKKKNKRKSSVTQETAVVDGQPDENISFFIDTTGTHSEAEPTNVNDSVKNGSKKKKAQSNLSFSNNNGNDDDNSNDAPLEVLYRNQNIKDSFNQNTSQNSYKTEVIGTQNESAKKKNKKKHNSSSKSEPEIETQNVEVQDIQPTLNESLKQDKKSRKTSEKTEQSDNLQCTINESAKKKNKKARKNSAENHNAEHLELTVSEIQYDQPLNDDSEKQNKNLNSSKNAESAESVNNVKPSKKRKRKSSANKTADEIVLKDNEVGQFNSNEPGESIKHKKRIKIGQDEDVKGQDSLKHNQGHDKSEGKSKKKKKTDEIQQYPGLQYETKKNKKRKERDDDDDDQITKISKQTSFDKVHVPRLPAAVLNQLDDKVLNDTAISKKTKVVSTTSFLVETTKRRKNKPSNYLEESVYLNDSVEERKQKGFIKNPKVLPFIPTVSTSDHGFTTNFKVNIIPQQIQFTAQSSGVNNFKKEFLEKERIKKLGTFEKYKRHRSIKISKF